MSWIWRALWILWGKKALVRECRRRGLAAYLRALRAARWTFIGLLFTFLFLQLMVVAGVGAVVTGLLLSEGDLQAKLQILFWICVALFSLPALAVTVLLSERFWLKASGAQRLIDDLEGDR